MLTEKYRPKDFNQVLGHAEIVKSIKELVESNSLPHAILLSGPNGVGKTTLARIIASKLDAEVTEVDGATFGRIEVMREIQESIFFLGLVKPRKVFIIDECQGLSKQAFDALLKIIEEPPSHVYFVFCTTEPEKVVRGVKQRCLHYHLSPISSEELEAFIKFVAEEEGYSLDNDIISLVVREAYGSPRQALNNLLQVKDASSVEEASIILSSPLERKEVLDLCRNIVKKAGPMEAFSLINKLRELNPLSIKIQVENYLTGCVLNAKNEKEAVRFLNLLSAFREADGSLPSLVLAIGKIYFGE